jgi:hypothetical protein
LKRTEIGIADKLLKCAHVIEGTKGLVENIPKESILDDSGWIITTLRKSVCEKE